MAHASFTFEKKEMEARVGKLGIKIERAVFGVADYYDGRIEAWMKQKAPWNDQTTNARNGLFAYAEKVGSLVRIILGHSVDYGIYLELGTRRSKVRTNISSEGVSTSKGYPIIVPAMDLWGPKVWAKLYRLIDRMK